ncbi:MAG: phage virion morphogenesis protein [Deltaproteobacteria bacterium]|jgi:phage gpG-like protein|nr:phage virion morphogenesis protein [Deltaproteobacteria bacterium]
MAININVEYGQALLKHLDKLKKELIKPVKLKREIAGYLKSETQDKFDREIDPWGVPWIPSQRVLASGGKTLYKTGRLAASFAVGMEGENIFLGQMSNVKYFPPHQWGYTTKKSKKKVKPRPMLPLRGGHNEVDLPLSYESGIKTVIQKWLDELIP